MPRLPLAIILVAALLASACTLRAASAQSLFEALAHGARQIADSGDLGASLPPAPMLAGLTHTASLVARSATRAADHHRASWPEGERAHFDAYAAALAHKSAAATPLGAALDAIAAHAAPEVPEAPPEPIALLPSSTPSESVPMGALAMTNAAPVADETALAVASTEQAEVAEATAEVVIPAQDLDDAPTATANDSAGVAEAQAAQDAEAVSPLSGFEAVAQAVAQVASAEPAQAEAPEATAAPAVPAEIERIMSDSEAPAAPARPARPDRIVVAAVTPGQVAELEDMKGASITARTVAYTSAPARARHVERRAKAEAPAARKLAKPRPTQHAQAAPPVAELPPPAEERVPYAYEMRRPPRGLFQFQ